MKEFVEIFYAQSPEWRVATLALVVTLMALVAGGLAAFFQELVGLTLGPVRLRIRIWQVRRETRRIAVEDAERRERQRLNAVVQFPVH